MSDQQYVDMCKAYDGLKFDHDALRFDYDALKKGYLQVIEENTQLREERQKLAMTKRDAYAMAAMTAYLSSELHSLRNSRLVKEDIAKESFEMAEAMMAVV